MKVSFEGAWRFSGSYGLMDSDLSDLRPGHSRWPARLEIDASSGDLEIVSTTGSERLGPGRYRVRVRLTKKEIANLAKIALRNEPFGDVVDSLSQCRECESRKHAEFKERVRRRQEERLALTQAVSAG
jgi:hypothetical protein